MKKQAKILKLNKIKVARLNPKIQSKIFGGNDRPRTGNGGLDPTEI